MTRFRLLAQCLAFVAAGLVASVLFAADAATAPNQAPAPVTLSIKDVAGQTLTVPDAQRPTVLLFAMVDQDRSIKALQQAAALLAANAQVQTTVIVSGQDAAANIVKIAAASGWKGSIAADPGYDLSGKLGVRVWPTTVILSHEGGQIAHLAGLSDTYAKELQNYVELALGHLTQAQVDQNLAQYEVIASSPQAILDRHIQVATRLVNLHDLDGARKELQLALEGHSQNAHLLALLAKVELLSDQPDAALKIVDQMDAKALPAWQTAALRGRALLALGQWGQAINALTQGLTLNPAPAEVHYLLGRAYEARGDSVNALAHYRAAFEHTADAGQLSDHEKQPAAGH